MTNDTKGESLEPGNARVVVDQDKCVGVGKCEMLEPEAMEVDEDTAIASMIEGTVLPLERAQKLVTECPSSAISIGDIEGSQTSQNVEQQNAEER